MMTSFLDSVTEPFLVHIMINGKNYGSGSGASKRSAKTKATIEAMDKLVPGFKVGSVPFELGLNFANLYKR